MAMTQNYKKNNTDKSSHHYIKIQRERAQSEKEGAEGGAAFKKACAQSARKNRFL